MVEHRLIQSPTEISPALLLYCGEVLYWLQLMATVNCNSCVGEQVI